MEEPVSSVLLQEFRAFRDAEFRVFRDELTAWKQEVGERLASLEADVKSGIKGNGQPSRLTTVEERLTELQRVRWKAVGAFVAVWALFTTALTTALHFVPWLHK